MKLYKGDESIEAVWVVDSETGRQYLLDVKTGEKLAGRDPETGFICPPEGFKK